MTRFKFNGYPFALLLLLFSTHSWADKPQENASVCFNNVALTPNFIALRTSFDSKLANWYQQVFKLDIVKEFSFPDGNTKGVLMKRNDFVVEVFNQKNINEKSTTTATTTRGVMKFGFYINTNLTQLQQCLIEHDVNAIRIFKDDNLDANLLLVEDLEGNHFEIISRQ